MHDRPIVMERLSEMSPAPFDDPKELARTARLRDGTPVSIRPIRADDAPRLIDLYSSLSKRSAYQRFFTLRRRLPADWARHLADVDYRRRMALIADCETVDAPELIGVARYESGEADDVPEIALVVQDGWQGRGLGTLLLSDIFRAAQARGLQRFRASVLADNRPMLTLLRRHAEIVQRRIEDGVLTLTFELRRSRPVSAPSGEGSRADRPEKVSTPPDHLGAATVAGRSLTRPSRGKRRTAHRKPGTAWPCCRGRPWRWPGSRWRGHRARPTPA
jgi:RimJ/RimL family protein N-acetyltransferase